MPRSSGPDDSFPVNPGAPFFFISYAWAYVPSNQAAQRYKYRYVRELFDDISASVADLIPLAVGQEPGFLDRATMTGGQRWEADVMHAVSTCQVFIPLLTSSYPLRHWCEREWKTFTRRVAVSRSTGRPTPNTSILPVLWTPGGEMPGYIAKVGRFVPAGLPQSYVDHYLENGLYGLARVYPDEFEAVAWRLATSIQDCWKARSVEPSPPRRGRTIRSEEGDQE